MTRGLMARGSILVVFLLLACGTRDRPSSTPRPRTDGGPGTDGGIDDDAAVSSDGGDVLERDGGTTPCSAGSSGGGDTCEYTWTCSGVSHALGCNRTSGECACDAVGSNLILGDPCSLTNAIGTAFTACGWSELGISATPSSCSSSGSSGSGERCDYSWTCDDDRYELNCNATLGVCACNSVLSGSVIDPCNLSDAKSTANTLCGWSLP